MKRLIFIISFFVYSGYYAGLAFIFSFNLSSLSRFYSVPLRVVMALIMLAIIHRFRKRLVQNTNSHYAILFIVFWIFYTVKVLFTESTTSSHELARIWIEYPLYALLYVVIPFMAYYSIDIKKYQKDIINGFISSGFILGLVSLYLYGKFLAQGIGRLNLVSYQTGEEVLNPLALSYAGVLTIVLCIYRLLILKERRKLQIVYLISTIILSFILFLLGSSRGSVIAIMLTLPVFIAYSGVKQKFKFITVSILSIPIIIWAMEASGSSLFERMGNTVEDKGGGRESLWANAFSHFLENPIFGGKIEIGGIYPHNFILEILMSTGLLGIILFMTVLIKGFFLGRKNASIDNTSVFALLLLVVGFSQYSFSGGVYTAINLFVPLGIIFGIQNNNTSN
ncbi:O-antigen ligase family protein [Arenibacter sp. M-2]|uniref:O-antigen ligase family protein n=1 Tax=Arenibacter sp. M-2 TaxID=3053612 RepID=UPI00257020FC|nr:O-antigen ligase family protein [Arenibacter sp. M-2]MDL5514500.1 O-antigen ligase family protein [Arenibacter sp. M-2]